MENQPGIPFKQTPLLVDSVEWNEESQLVVCLEDSVHILTPIMVGLLATKQRYKDVGLTLPPLQKKFADAIITEVDKVQTSFLNEEAFRLAKWSPPGISPNKSCFLAVLTTKHRVLIYQISTVDSAASDWLLYTDLTDKIKDHAIEHTYKTKINPHHTLSIGWSKCIIPDPLATKPVLLATSNKAGDVCIWSYTDTFEYKTQVTPHKSFVNLVEWTKWKQINNTTYIAYIVSACTDGTVAISSVQVKISVVSESKTTQIKDIKMNVLKVWFQDNDRSVTTLIKTFDDYERSVVKIAISKGAKMGIMNLSVEKDNTLAAQKDWQVYILPTSSLGLTSGMWVGADEGVDYFRGYTVEGECIYLEVDSDGNVACNKQMSAMWSTKLIQKYKLGWAEEQMKVDDDHIIAASDASPFLWGTTDSAHEIFTAFLFNLRPNVDIHYTGETSESSSLRFLLNRERGEDIESVCQLTSTYINDPYFVFGKPVRGLVRELLQYLVDDADDEPMELWLSIIANYLDAEDIATSESTLTERIYCETSTNAARIINNTYLELQQYKPPNFGSEYESTCQKAKTVVQANHVNSVLTYANQLSDEAFDQLTEQDVAVLLLISDVALVLREEALVKQALNIYVKIQDIFHQDQDLLTEIAYATSFSQESAPMDGKARNKCPVCDKSVILLDGGSNIAQCEAGHFWEVCSVTRRVLHSPKVRKCLACKAKSLQPTEEDTLTNTILKSCWKCLYCGSGLINSI